MDDNNSTTMVDVSTDLRSKPLRPVCLQKCSFDSFCILIMLLLDSSHEAKWLVLVPVLVPVPDVTHVGVDREANGRIMYLA